MRFPTAVKELIETDVNATEIHVSRFTLHKTGAVTEAEDLLMELSEAPRHALDWASMMGALSIFDRRMKIGQNNASHRLSRITTALSQSGIVNQLTLGHYKARKIESSFLPPTNRAKWNSDAYEFVGGGSVTTTVLTRLGRVIGRHNQTDNSIFPHSWQLTDAYIIPDMICMNCYVGPLSQKMAQAIQDSSGTTGSDSSVSSQHDQSRAAILVANIPEELISHIAIRGDRYAYILDNEKSYIVSYVGYGMLSLIKCRLRDCKFEDLTIFSTIA
jgi:hypothetical protein